VSAALENKSGIYLFGNKRELAAINVPAGVGILPLIFE